MSTAWAIVGLVVFSVSLGLAWFIYSRPKRRDGILYVRNSAQMRWALKHVATGDAIEIAPGTYNEIEFSPHEKRANLSFSAGYPEAWTSEGKLEAGEPEWRDNDEQR